MLDPRFSGGFESRGDGRLPPLERGPGFSKSRSFGAVRAVKVGAGSVLGAAGPAEAFGAEERA